VHLLYAAVSEAQLDSPIIIGSRTTRLETRTKESTECASLMVSNQSLSEAVEA
jgi:hypothetical protein